LLLVVCVVSNCKDDVLTAQEVADPRQPADYARLTERELLIATLRRLDELERHIHPASGMYVDPTGATVPPPNGPGNGQGSQGQLGVPQQLDLLRAQVALLNEKMNEVIVGIGLPEPPDGNMSDSDLFKTTSKLCFSLGTGVDTKLTGGGEIKSNGKGGVGIDFYGNKMLVELGGWGAIKGELSVAPIKAAATYTFCVDARRQEAQALMAALPFSASEFESRFQSLTSHVREVRTAPFTVINPDFRLFGMAEGGYPSATEMVNRVDNFFSLVKGPVCSRLKSRFNIVKDLGLGEGPLAGITSPAVNTLQARFNSDC
jgi:hypothetical protein